MPKRRKERVERRKLADGTIKEYRYAIRGPKPVDAKTVTGVIAAWQVSPEWLKLAKSTRTSYTHYMQPFYEAFQHTPIASVKRRHILELRDMINAERGPGAASGFCKAVYGLFKWVLNRGYVDISPATKLEGALTHGSLDAWTLEQALKAEAELPQHYARAVFLARHTAQRRGDLCSMRWSQYDGNTIRLTQQKTQVSLVLPVVPELKAALDAWKREAKGLTILANAKGQPLTPGTLSGHLPEELVKIGLPPLGIHGLRKLAATILANAGCSTHEIAAITGHKTLAMVQKYTESADQRSLASAAVLRLDFDKRGKNAKNS